MRELMAHSVEVWESDPKAYSYHPVGYMQISPEVFEVRTDGYLYILIEDIDRYLREFD